MNAEDIPIYVIEEELMGHLIEAHGATPEKLLHWKTSMIYAQWVGFLMRSHMILHTIDEHGEYHDERFHFKRNSGDSGANSID